MAKHRCDQWTYFSGMATCPHGYELLPNGQTRGPATPRWKSHRRALARARVVKAR